MRVGLCDLEVAAGDATWIASSNVAELLLQARARTSPKQDSRKFWPSRARSRPAAPHSSGLPTRRTLILRLHTTPAPEKLHVVGDDINLASLGAILGLPGTVL